MSDGHGQRWEAETFYRASHDLSPVKIGLLLCV